MNQHLLHTLYFLRYLLVARHRKGFGVHSPFIFNFIANVLVRNKNHDHDVGLINRIKKDIAHKEQMIKKEGFGAGSGYGHGNNISLKKLLHQQSINHKYGRLLYKMSAYYQPSNIIELGTSLGISTLYLALGCRTAEINTIEGDRQLYQVAGSIISTALPDNRIHILHNEFSEVIESLFKNKKEHLMVFIDGNHQKEATLEYCELIRKHVDKPSIIIIDDIHWSSEMLAAWKEICAIPEFTFTIDLFRLGIVFTQKSAAKQHFVIKY